MGQQQAADLHDIMQRDKTELENGQRTPARVQETTGGESDRLRSDISANMDQTDSPNSCLKRLKFFSNKSTHHRRP